jgi:hypothetical protein
MRFRGLLVGLALGLMAAPAALANDSTAELAAGGLVLRRTANIEMRSEDLYISPTAVRVDYRFFNTSRRDISVTVAFPMPDITFTDEDTIVSIPNHDQVNFLGFSTTVDGRPVRAQVEQKVFVHGVDRTDYLRGLGVPLAPQLEATRRALDHLPAATRAALVSQDIAQISEYDVGHGMERHWVPTWTLRTTYYWTQVFPARREISVQHRYTPSLGASAGTAIGSPGYRTSPEYRQRVRLYCLDETILQAADASARTAGGYSPMQEQRLGYVLTTGANWARPIGDFHMVIDKGRPDAIVSFCGTGVRRISPTQFEVRYRNFIPRRDVAVLILLPPAN